MAAAAASPGSGSSTSSDWIVLRDGCLRCDEEGLRSLSYHPALNAILAVTSRGSIKVIDGTSGAILQASALHGESLRPLSCSWQWPFRFWHAVNRGPDSGALAWVAPSSCLGACSGCLVGVMCSAPICSRNGTASVLARCWVCGQTQQSFKKRPRLCLFRVVSTSER